MFQCPKSNCCKYGTPSEGVLCPSCCSLTDILRPVVCPYFVFDCDGLLFDHSGNSADYTVSPEPIPKTF